jgi:hypothetical protein
VLVWRDSYLSVLFKFFASRFFALHF